MVNQKNKPPACSPHQPQLSAEDFPALSKDPNDNNEVMFKRFLTIKHTDPDIKMADLNPFEVERKLKTVLGKKHTCKINKIRSGLLLIEVDRKQIVDQLLRTRKIADIPVVIEEHKALNSSMGMVYCDNAEVKKMSNEEIQAEMENQQVTKVHRITKRNGDHHEPTNLFIITFGKPLLPTHVKIGYLNVEVRLYIPNPRRCFNCQRYGHGNSTCTHDTVCPTCGQTGHEYGADDCDKIKKCYHCESETHDATSRDCPMYKLEKLILEKKIRTHVDFKVARRIVYHDNPELTSQIPRLNKNNPKTTYSNVTAQSPVSAELLQQFAAQQKTIENQQELIQILTEKVTKLQSAQSQSPTMDMDISEFQQNKGILRKRDNDSSSEDLSVKPKRVSYENSASFRQEVTNMSGLKLPLSSDQRASSNGLEDRNKPAPSPSADASKKARESPLGSTGVKGASSPSSTPVVKGPTPMDDHPLGASGFQVADQSKGGGKKSTHVENKSPPKDNHPSVDDRSKGGDKNPQKTSPNGGGKNNNKNNRYQHVKSKITYN